MNYYLLILNFALESFGCETVASTKGRINGGKARNGGIGARTGSSIDGFRIQRYFKNHFTTDRYN